MRKVVLLVILLGLAGPAAGEVTVDLREAERLALEKNLNLKAESFATLASEAVVRRGYGLYDPQGKLNFSLADTEDPLNSIFASFGNFSSTTQTTSSLANLGII